MKRKAQSMSLGIIITAAMLLVVLGVMLYIFSGESSKIVKSQDCTTRGGVCMAKNTVTTETEEEEAVTKYACPSDKPIKVTTKDCQEVYTKEKIRTAQEQGNAVTYEQATKDGPGQCCLALG